MKTIETLRTEEEFVAATEEKPVAENANVTSRRGFLTMGAAAAAILGATAAEAQTSTRGRYLKPKPITPPGTGIDASAQWKDPILRLVRRITMGLNPVDVALARQLGYTGYLNYQLDAASIDDSAVDAVIATKFPLLAMTYTQLTSQDGGEVNAQLQDAAFYRAVFSKRQLKERMMEFWTDHFTISLDKVGIRKAIDDRDVIRPNALGNFPTLLRATSKSGAMLVYLDQNSSRFPTPNQNYAREIMELHTLGVDGGYTQTDVAELSRILTGWSVNGAGGFVFNKNQHDRGQNGPKTFLGRVFPTMASTVAADIMQKEGEDAIDMLVAHPKTAAYIALKLSRWLLAYTPPQAVVDQAAAVYLQTNGSIPAMVRIILSRDNLMAAPAKLKRPFHYAASGMRAMGAVSANIRPIRQSADTMGQPMFEWQQPNGYPDRVDWWSGLILNRWQFSSTLSTQNSIVNTLVDLTPFRAGGTASSQIAAKINSLMFGGELTATQVTQLQTYLGATVPNDTKVRETLALAMGSAQFQWY